MELKKNEGLGDRKFIVVLADGKFHQTVPEGTEGAVIRTYEDNDGAEQSKLELVFDEVKGVITSISFEDSQFGKNLQIEIDNEGVISMGTASSFGEDLMKKLPNLDLDKEVRLVPYAFTPKGESKTKKGVTVYQDEKKIESFYWDKETSKNINGIPEVEGDTKTFDSDDWKMHFMVVRKFLIKEIEKLPKYVVRETKATEEVKKF